MTRDPGTPADDDGSRGGDAGGTAEVPQGEVPRAEASAPAPASDSDSGSGPASAAAAAEPAPAPAPVPAPAPASASDPAPVPVPVPVPVPEPDAVFAVLAQSTPVPTADVEKPSGEVTAGRRPDAADAGRDSAAAEEATAPAAASAPAGEDTEPDGGSGAAGAAGGGRPPGRVPRPVMVAAAFAGVLLLGIPVAVWGLQHRDTGSGGQDGTRANDRLAGTVLGDSAAPGVSVGSAAPTSTGGAKAKKGKPSAHTTLPAAGTGDGVAAEGGPGAGDSASPAGRTTATASGTAAAKDGGQAPAAVAPTTPPIVYTAVAGPNCESGQRFQKHGYVSDAKTGWSTSTGGYVGGGCDGHYVSVPMSGSATKDAGNTTNWLFDLPASVSACKVSVYIPRNSSVLKVGGTDTYYTVYRYFLPKDSNLLGHFTINQVAHEGSWYNLSGWYPITEKKLSVELHDRGLDWQGSTRTYAHHAASAVKVSCTS
ncbi:hypothetical protein ACIQU5_11745 [Streptomyces sp. NPDC090306]|uniref:hypothetical protein n=1 Tax=Streptomyces sp. NPDC090306 TaxID=3365961 RepID=UPI0038131274